jgi:hypothetical protein
MHSRIAHCIDDTRLPRTRYRMPIPGPAHPHVTWSARCGASSPSSSFSCFGFGPLAATLRGRRGRAPAGLLPPSTARTTARCPRPMRSHWMLPRGVPHPVLHRPRALPAVSRRSHALHRLPHRMRSPPPRLASTAIPLARSNWRPVADRDAALRTAPGH